MSLHGHDLKKHILHNPIPIFPRQFKTLPPKRTRIEPPARHRQRRHRPRLARTREQRQLRGFHAGVAGGPAFSRDGVSFLAVHAQGGAVHEDLGDGSQGLGFAEAEQPAGDGGGGEFHEQDVVVAVGVEGVAEEETPLDFVGFD